MIQKHVRMRHKRLWFLGLRKGSTLIQRSWRRSAFWTQFKETDPRQQKIEADWMARTVRFDRFSLIRLNSIFINPI